MIIANPRILSSRSNACIWCGKRLLRAGAQPDQSVNFGPVMRSKEHIIPENIGGALITWDLCKRCNDKFGEHVDCHLPRDGRVVAAANKVGIDFKDLVKRFQGTQQAKDGRQIRITHQNGCFRLDPCKTNQLLSVGCIGGKIHPVDLQNLSQSMIQKRKSELKVSILTAEDELRIKHLINDICENPDQPHYDPVLDIRVKPTELSTSVNVSMESAPWKTDWCIAKMLFEFTMARMPAPFLSYLRPVQDSFRKFVNDGLARKHNNTGETIFQSGNEESSEMSHSVEITTTHRSYRAEVRLFGSACWRFSCNLKPNKPPPAGECRLTVLNPIGSKESQPTVDVVVL